MKLLFVHDHKFRLVNDKIYSTGGLSDDALIRYTSVFGRTTVLARVKKEEVATGKYSEIQNPDVQVKDGYLLGKEGILEEVKQADYVISRMPSFLGLKVIKLAKQLNKPCLIEVVGCPWDSLWNHSLKGKLAAPYMTYATKATVKTASHVLYVTNEFLQGRYPSRGLTVNCSNVALTRFDDTLLERRLARIDAKREKIIIGTTAAVDVRYKGQQYMIKALAKLKKMGYSHFEYQLVGAGDPSYLKAVAAQEGVEEQVIFLGPKPHTEVFNWLEEIDIYAQPSRQEGLPRALIEAMSRGVPSIGARTGGIPELLDERYIFSNTKSIIKDICDILTNMDKETLILQAIRNYREAKAYDKTTIDERRSHFFRRFINDVSDEFN